MTAPSLRLARPCGGPSALAGRGLRHAARRLAALVALLLAAAWLAPQPHAWDRVRLLERADQQGPALGRQARALLAVIEEASTQDDLARLRSVNEFFNRRVAFRDDLAVWGQLDYWASPLEMLGKGQGDCEDYATAKYFTLVASGLPAAKLRLVYVRAQLGGPGGPTQAHMVLAYYAEPDAQPLILDNLINEIRPAERRPDLTPVFSFNAEGLWQGVGAVRAGDPVVRLSRWRDLLAKARDEGLW